MPSSVPSFLVIAPTATASPSFVGAPQQLYGKFILEQVARQADRWQRPADRMTAAPNTSAPFYVGVFLMCASALMLQLCETRILSVISYYYFAFFAVSMAMLGMTVGSLIIYFNKEHYRNNNVNSNLAWISVGLTLSIIFSIVSLTTSVLLSAVNGIVLSVLQWLKLIVVLLPPYVFVGMGTSIALTRSPWPVGFVYSADLAGAAFGCIGALALMHFVDGVSAMLMVAASGAAAALAFACGCNAKDVSPINLPTWLRWLLKPATLVVALTVMAIGNAAIYPRGLELSFIKDQIEIPQTAEYMRWNSFSRIRVERANHGPAEMWGASLSMPPVQIDQRTISIDQGAGTKMYRFGGDIKDVDFLKYDITNLAYYIRNKGRAAVIGIGGGRDMLAARVFGFADVTGVELNPIIVDLLTRRFRDFNRLADQPGVRFETDEARSWFAARGRDQQFDIVQMSLVDTWAATSVGAFSLSENGLYTVEGWRRFLRGLASNGVLTVSRWYSPTNTNETGRLLSLAKASLMAEGVTDPGSHLFLAAFDELATLIVGRAPLSSEDIAKLRETTSRLGFAILFSPDAPAATDTLREIVGAPDNAALEALSAQWHIDVTAPTDDRPFFFNQLRIFDAASITMASQAATGAFNGNLWATVVLAIIVLISFSFVILTILIPALPSLRQISPSLSAFGTGYFLFIGVGFMLVEVGLVQRLSLFLGHPVYGLAIGLFAVILSTGVGSMISSQLTLRTICGVPAWSWFAGALIAALPWLLSALSGLDAYSIWVRAGLVVLVVSPLGVLLGFAFPTGMTLVNRLDPRPTPWFWAINGAASVLGASLALAVNNAISISASLWFAAVCYLLAGISAVPLIRGSLPMKAIVSR